jgi:hypothetical protein
MDFDQGSVGYTFCHLRTAISKYDASQFSECFQLICFDIAKVFFLKAICEYGALLKTEKNDTSRPTRFTFTFAGNALFYDSSA